MWFSELLAAVPSQEGTALRAQTDSPAGSSCPQRCRGQCPTQGRSLMMQYRQARRPDRCGSNQMPKRRQQRGGPSEPRISTAMRQEVGERKGGQPQESTPKKRGQRGNGTSRPRGSEKHQGTTAPHENKSNTRDKKETRPRKQAEVFGGSIRYAVYRCKGGPHQVSKKYVDVRAKKWTLWHGECCSESITERSMNVENTFPQHCQILISTTCHKEGSAFLDLKNKKNQPNKTPQSKLRGRLRQKHLWTTDWDPGTNSVLLLPQSRIVTLISGKAHVVRLLFLSFWGPKKAPSLSYCFVQFPPSTPLRSGLGGRPGGLKAWSPFKPPSSPLRAPFVPPSSPLRAPFLKTPSPWSPLHLEAPLKSPWSPPWIEAGQAGDGI